MSGQGKYLLVVILIIVFVTVACSADESDGKPLSGIVGSGVMEEGQPQGTMGSQRREETGDKGRSS